MLRAALALGFGLMALSPVASQLDDVAAQYYGDIVQHHSPATLWRFAFDSYGPENCTPIAPSGEGFPRVQCADGVWYRDMDGQMFDNDEGYPVYLPGTWVKERAR